MNMKIEVKQKIDPCLALSANGIHYTELVKDEMKGQIIDKIFEMVEPYIHTDENYNEIKMSLNVDTLTERVAYFNDGYPQMGERTYLKIY